MTKLLPFWKEVFLQSELEVSYVITLRHPVSVCKSLAKRDGFDIEKGGFLWLEHVLNSLTETIGENRIIVDYDRLMQSPESELKRMAKAFHLSITPSELKKFTDEFLDPTLQHTIYQIDDLVLERAIPPLVREVYMAVLKAATNSQTLNSSSFATKIMKWNREYSQQKLALLLADKLTLQITSRNQSIRYLTKQNAQLAERNAELHEIKSSKAWQLVMMLRETRLFLLPPDSLREHIARIAINRLRLLKVSFEQKKKDKQLLKDYSPSVSVIIPNYNHASFLEERINTILEQSYQNFKVLILDDCSTDNSRDIILDYAERYPNKITYIFNERNSGNVFRQWRKGIEHTTGNLIWICESDDFSETDFLEKIIKHFANLSVSIAFGKIQFSDDKGVLRKGLDRYRERAERGIWNHELIRPAYKWFANGFGVNNLIANVGGCVFRKQPIPDYVWEEAETYSVLGDWFLYCHIANGGMIAYDPDAVSYFRQHGENTSVSSFSSLAYYLEHQKFMEKLKTFWDVPGETVENFIQKVEFQYKHFQLERNFGEFGKHINKKILLEKKRERLHILIGMLGFSSGGGELFPIHLANQLQKSGCIVSLFVYDISTINQDMYNIS